MLSGEHPNVVWLITFSFAECTRETFRFGVPERGTNTITGRAFELGKVLWILGARG